MLTLLRKVMNGWASKYACSTVPSELSTKLPFCIRFSVAISFWGWRSDHVMRSTFPLQTDNNYSLVVNVRILPGRRKFLLPRRNTESVSPHKRQVIFLAVDLRDGMLICTVCHLLTVRVCYHRTANQTTRKTSRSFSLAFKDLNCISVILYELFARYGK